MGPRPDLQMCTQCQKLAGNEVLRRPEQVVCCCLLTVSPMAFHEFCGFGYSWNRELQWVDICRADSWEVASGPLWYDILEWTACSNYGVVRVLDIAGLECHSCFYCWMCGYAHIQGVPLLTKPGSSLIILPLMRILQRNLKRTYLIV